MDKKSWTVPNCHISRASQITPYLIYKENIYRADREDTLGKNSQIGNRLLYVDKYGK